MANPKRDDDLAARVLLEAYLTDDRTAADKYEISARTLRRYKKALAEDSELSALFRSKLNGFINRSWADELEQALQETVQKLRQLIEESSNLNDVVEAFKTLSEVAITKEVLSVAGNAQQDRKEEKASSATLPTAYKSN